MKMPYGINRGKEIGGLSNSYLSVIIKTWRQDTMQDKLVFAAATKEVERRKKINKFKND